MNTLYICTCIYSSTDHRLSMVFADFRFNKLSSCMKNDLTDHENSDQTCTLDYKITEKEVLSVCFVKR